jgi:hypothetical protein
MHARSEALSTVRSQCGRFVFVKNVFKDPEARLANRGLPVEPLWQDTAQ